MAMTTIDLRSDTVTRPDGCDARRDAAGAARRRRVRRRPDGQRIAGKDCHDARQGGGAVHALGHAEQPVGADGALPARRRILGGPGRAHLPLRGGRGRGARQHPAPADRQPARRLAGTGRHRGRHQARRCALCAHAAAVPGEHLRWQRAQHRLLAPGHRPGPPPWPGDASGWRAAVQCRRRAGRRRRCARQSQGDGATVRQRVGVLQQRPRRTGGLGAGRQPRLDRACPSRAQDARRRVAPGRRVGRRRPACAGSPHRSPGRGSCTRAAAGRWPARARRCGQRAGADEHGLCRPRIRRAVRAGHRWSACATRGLLCTGLYKLRLVTHLDVERQDIDRAVRILRETL